MFEVVEIVKESDLFEMFVNYSLVSSFYNKSFDISSVTVGSGDDTGIDGVAILVNGHLIENTDEVDELLKLNGHLEVSYIFAQAKTSSTFSSDGLLLFYNGVKDFFADKPTLRRNADIKRMAELSDYLFSKAASFRVNPTCLAYYVTTGRLVKDENHLGISKRFKQELEQTSLFSNVESVLWGATEVCSAYRKTKSPITSTFTFSNKVALPNIEGIRESYFGVIPFSECRKILVDSNDNIMSVFDDNVRDFQGEANAVNRKISETLNSDNPRLFSVLNNGVTIVADGVQTSGNQFTIEDYQIVNGCQTSNVLYENRHVEGIDSVDVPIRLIVTDDNVMVQRESDKVGPI